MEAIVLAGGKGTRLREVVADVPKPMAPVAGRPFLEIILNYLLHKGFQRVVFSLGFQADMIYSYFGERYSDMTLAYVVENMPLGTGGGLRLAMSACEEDHVFVFNGDTYLDLEVEAVENQWQCNKHPLIIGRKVDDTTRFGRLRTRSGQVVGFSEKGIAGPGLINAGCYVFSQAQLNEFPVNTTFSLEHDYLAKIVLNTPFDLYVTNGFFIDIGIPEDYFRAQTELAGLLP